GGLDLRVPLFCHPERSRRISNIYSRRVIPPVSLNGQDVRWPHSQDGCATYFPAVRGFQLLLPARFSSSLRLRAGSSRRSFRPSSNRAMPAHLADAGTRDRSLVSAPWAWLLSPVA